MMDGTIPAGTQVRVQSRAADSKALVSNAPWNTEPLPYLRSTGSELPYYRPQLDCCSSRTGTWELLFQAAKGRYLAVAVDASPATGAARRAFKPCAPTIRDFPISPSICRRCTRTTRLRQLYGALPRQS